MKILLTSVNHFKDAPGGQPRIVLDESEELARRGFEVFVLAGGFPGLPEYEEVRGVHLLRYLPKRQAAFSPSRMSAHTDAAEALLRKFLPRVDVIHGHAPLPYLAAIDCYRSVAHTSYTVHSPVGMEMKIAWSNAGLLRWLAMPIGISKLEAVEREILRRSKTITSLSSFTVSCLQSIHGRAIGDRIIIVPGWTDTSEFAPISDRTSLKQKLGWSKDVPVLFTLRRMEKRMGLGTLLDAAAFLRQREMRFQLIIAGEGSLRPMLESKAQKLGLNGIVRFPGLIANGDLPLCYAACDAFVLPTAALECFGLIAIEALSAGRPVLATPVGAIPEIIEPIRPDWLARSTSAEDIADLLSSFLHKRLSISTPEDLHQYVAQTYEKDRVLERLIELCITPRSLETRISP